MTPTYKATEILSMCTSFKLEYDTFKVLVDLIEDELPLYSDEDLIILMQASVVMFTRSLLKLGLNNMR